MGLHSAKRQWKAEYMGFAAAAMAAVLLTAACAPFIKSAAAAADINLLKYTLCRGVPAAKPAVSPQQGVKISFNDLFLGFDVQNPASILTNQIAVVSAARLDTPTAQPELSPQPAPSPSEEPQKLPIVEMDGASGNTNAATVQVKNNTTYAIDVPQLQNGLLNFNFQQPGPKVLIVHSHSSEAYAATDENYYLPTDPDRTEDQQFNVVRVGQEIADTLTKMGVEVIHDRTVHDYPSYNGSYKNSLATVQKNLEQYPSIKVVIDVHRDAIVRADGTKMKLVTDIDGQKAAQVMIVTGTNQGGLDHPNWQENLKFATKFQERMDRMYPGLARPVNLTKERYNTHTTLASVILEVGCNGNTLEEAIRGGRYAARALGDLINAMN